jgi:hypothetical protein
LVKLLLKIGDRTPESAATIDSPTLGAVSGAGQIPEIEKPSANALKNLILQKLLEGCTGMTD